LARRNLPPVAFASIALAVLAFISMGLGFLTTPLPMLGALFSFAAPALALAGLIAGRVATARAKDAGQSTATASVGSLLSGLCLLPALMTAMTCGLCNAMLSTGKFETHRSVQWSTQSTGRSGAPQSAPGTQPAAPPTAPLPPSAPGAPPPAFPPPPIAPGRTP